MMFRDLCRPFECTYLTTRCRCVVIDQSKRVTLMHSFSRIATVSQHVNMSMRRKRTNVMHPQTLKFLPSSHHISHPPRPILLKSPHTYPNHQLKLQTKHHPHISKTDGPFSGYTFSLGRECHEALTLFGNVKWEGRAMG